MVGEEEGATDSMTCCLYQYVIPSTLFDARQQRGKAEEAGVTTMHCDGSNPKKMEGVTEANSWCSIVVLAAIPSSCALVRQVFV